MNEFQKIVDQIQALFRTSPELALLVNGGHVLQRQGSEDKDRIYYVINRSDRKAGLFSYYFTALSHVMLAQSRGWIPVVDMQTGYYYLCHEDERQAGHVNVWDDYFLQPGGVSLERTRRAAQVVHASGVWGFRGELDFARMNPGDPVYELCRNVGDCMALNPVLQAYCAQVQAATLATPEQAIGISYRLTYDKTRPTNHFVQPSLEDILHEVDALLARGDFERIFLATEDQASVATFVERYGAQRVHCVQRPRVGDDSAQVPASAADSAIFASLFEDQAMAGLIEGVAFARERDKYRKACEYISEMHILSRCGGLIGARCNGTMYAHVRNGGRWRHLNLPVARYG